jgi:hypothetical protein
MKKKIVLTSLVIGVLAFQAEAQKLKTILREAAGIENKEQPAQQQQQGGNENNTKPEKESKDSAPSQPVNLEFDYRKHQLDYAKEFCATDGMLYEIEINSFFEPHFELTGKTMKKSDLVQMGKKSGNDWETKVSDESAPFYMTIDHGGKGTYYTNYDKGPSAWVSWSSKNKILENHGEGKKFTKQQALDYAGYMFFEGIAFYANYSRYDNGVKYKVELPNTIWVTDKKIVNQLTLALFKEKIENYLVKGENENDGFIKGLSLSLAAEDKAKNSIEGKSVKGLAIKTINGVSKLPINGSVLFNVEATLADGTVMSTGKGAYWSDYEITVDGGKIAENGKIIPYSAEGAIGFDISQVKDVVTVTIKSKTHSTAPVVLKLPIDYNVMTFKMDYSGNSHGRLAGIAAVVEVKQVKNSVDGSVLLEYRMRYRDENTWHHVVRLKPETQLFFKNDGATKAFTADKNGHDGGVGGEIRLYVDPSVAKYNFDASLRGAPGQKTKYPASYTNGAQGKDGNLIVEKRSVSW